MYLPYLHWLAQHPGVFISLALLMLVLLAGTALFLWPLATKLLGFVAVDGIQGVTDEAARTVSRLWYGWSR